MKNVRSSLKKKKTDRYTIIVARERARTTIKNTRSITRCALHLSSFYSDIIQYHNSTWAGRYVVTIAYMYIRAVLSFDE